MTQMMRDTIAEDWVICRAIEWTNQIALRVLQSWAAFEILWDLYASIWYDLIWRERLGSLWKLEEKLPRESKLHDPWIRTNKMRDYLWKSEDSSCSTITSNQCERFIHHVPLIYLPKISSIENNYFPDHMSNTKAAMLLPDTCTDSKPGFTDWHEWMTLYQIDTDGQRQWKESDYYDSCCSMTFSSPGEAAGSVCSPSHSAWLGSHTPFSDFSDQLIGWTSPILFQGIFTDNIMLSTLEKQTWKQVCSICEAYTCLHAAHTQQL